MPNRILRDWTDSETINELSVYAERFFTRLIMKVDDYGRFSANVKILKGSLFILRDDVRDADLARWMDDCQKLGLILIYEVGQKSYLQIQNFKQTLRQKKEKYPPPASATHTLLNSMSERKRNESETNPKGRGKEHTPEVFKNKGEDVLFTIEHCVVVALNDERWTRANKTTEKELKEFNLVLEKRGIYEKNPMDYKSHFASWKNSGKKDETTISTGLPHNLKKLN